MRVLRFRRLASSQQMKNGPMTPVYAALISLLLHAFVLLQVVMP